MKYIRTKDGIYERVMVVRQVCDNKEVAVIRPDKAEFEPIIKHADTIEELCDEFVCQENDNFYYLASRENISFRNLPNCYCKAIFGAIWTDKGLIYVAKMNDKGELELL